MQWILGSQTAEINLNSRSSLCGIILLSVIGVCVFILQPGYVQGLVEFLSLSEEQAGYVASAEMFGLAACTVLLIFISSRFDWRKLALFWLLVCTLGNLASIFVTDFSNLVVVRFLTGLGSGGIISLSFTMMGLTEKSDRNFGFVITWVLIYGALGLLLMPVAYGLVGMKGVLSFFAVFCFSGVFVLRYVPPSGEAHVQQHQADSVQYAWRLKIGFLLAILVYNIAIGMVWAYLFLVGLEAGIAGQSVANVLTLSQFLGIAGAFIAVLLQLKVGRTLPLLVGVLGSALGIASLVGQVNLVYYILGVCSFNLLWNLSMPYLLATMADFDASGKMVIYGISMQMTGTAIGPGVAATVLGYSNYDSVYLVAIALFVASMILLLPALYAQRKHYLSNFAGAADGAVKETERVG